jgi:hypothetical protein
MSTGKNWCHGNRLLDDAGTVGHEQDEADREADKRYLGDALLRGALAVRFALTEPATIKSRQRTILHV